MTNKIKVETTKKNTATGGTICGMVVTFSDGYQVNFIGRMGKKEAIRQAINSRKLNEQVKK